MLAERVATGHPTKTTFIKPSTGAEMITNSQIKKIKTLQRICGLDNDTYRDILRNMAGVNSCTELRSKRQIDSVITHLGNLAEKVDKKANRKVADWKWENMPEGKQLLEKAKSKARRPDTPSYSQFNYIFGLWWTLRSEWNKDGKQQMEPTLNHFLANGRAGSDATVANWLWLNQKMGNHLINVLRGRIAQVNKSKK